MRKLLLAIFVCVFSVSSVFGQEILTGLPGNPVIKNAQDQKQIKQIHRAFKSSRIEMPTPIVLPFFDDFKQSGFYPDTSRWMDNYVFINQDFALFPPSWGAATFDAVNQFGEVYSDANPLQFFADQLSSRPIRLDSIFDPTPRAMYPSDSVYLSFYYQPQGVGNDPQPQDSLVLDFGFYSGDYIFDRIDSILVPVSIYGVEIIYPGDTLLSPCDPTWGTRILDTLYKSDTVMLPCDSIFIPETKWKRVWSSKGMTLDSFRIFNDTSYFKQVFIPILDSAYFRNDFQFRFYNYASISNDNLQSWQSNCDYWNVDYVVMDRNRSRLDTTHKDITFVGRAPSLLAEYQSMPIYQYLEDPFSNMKRGLKMYISNLDNGNQTANYSYEVFNDLGAIDTTMTWNGGSADMFPFNQSGYVANLPFAFPGVKSFYKVPGNRESMYFDVHHYLAGDLQFGLTDTMSFRQEFKNYYAYDDGTPEFGYGLTPAGAQLAYRFTLSRRDTLRAINFYFNKTLSNANQQFFQIAVWNDLNGRPGNLVWLEERQKPVFGDSLYQFQTYHLVKPSYVDLTVIDTSKSDNVPVQGTFFIGWIQNSSHNLNVGFDANNDASGNIFYNVTGNEWQASSYTGALMIRPVLGKKLIEEEKSTRTSMDFFNIVPNPSNSGLISLKFLSYPGHSPFAEEISITPEVLHKMEVHVFNITGQRVFEGMYQNTLDLSFLNNGVYVIRIINPMHNTNMSQKLLIAK